jgi:hypothetical protein
MINPILSKGDSVDHCQEGEDGFLQYVTLRDYFAGLAMKGMTDSGLEFNEVASDAYGYADAMLSERAKPK